MHGCNCQSDFLCSGVSLSELFIVCMRVKFQSDSLVCIRVMIFTLLYVPDIK